MTDLRDSDEPYIFVTTEQDGQGVTKVSLQASDPLYIPWGEQCERIQHKQCDFLLNAVAS